MRTCVQCRTHNQVLRIKHHQRDSGEHSRHSHRQHLEQRKLIPLQESAARLLASHLVGLDVFVAYLLVLSSRRSPTLRSLFARTRDRGGRSGSLVADGEHHTSMQLAPHLDTIIRRGERSWDAIVVVFGHHNHSSTSHSCPYTTFAIAIRTYSLSSFPRRGRAHMPLLLLMFAKKK